MENCKKFAHLILSKIIVVTSCEIKCKSVYYGKNINHHDYTYYLHSTKLENVNGIKDLGRERTIRTRTDTIRYEYTQRPIPIRVLRALVSQPLVILDKAGHLRERSLYAMGGTCRPLATHKLARSVSFMTQQKC